VIRKSRPSCFAGTTLETHLRVRGIRTLVVIGIAINVGVEWTLCEAMSREFYGVLVEDATMAAGPAEVHRATVYNVERFIGWVTTTAQFEIAARALAGAASSVPDGIRSYPFMPFKATIESEFRRRAGARRT